MKSKRILAAAIAVAAGSALVSYGGYKYLRLREENKFLGERIAELEGQAAGLSGSLASTARNLASAAQENSDLNQSLAAEQNRNNSFQTQISDLSGTVSDLTKLSETDPQLLAKYSKVYFLNENYAPNHLSSIDAQYLYDRSRPELIRSGALPFLEAMLSQAKRDGEILQVASAYRSFYQQAILKLDYKVVYGAGTANQFSADQGYSEHQLGTAVDFVTPEQKGAFVDFEKTKAYAWMAQNAYKYGFVLSYPQNNPYYEFEPWHWRFVGVALATALHNGNEYFYNMSQSDINKYLITIFDQ